MVLNSKIKYFVVKIALKIVVNIAILYNSDLENNEILKVTKNQYLK